MNHYVLTGLLFLGFFSSVAQWNNTGNNNTTGKLGIGFSNAPSFSLDIQTPATFGGMQLFNPEGDFVRLYAPSLTMGAFNNTTGLGDAGIIFGTFTDINTNDYGFTIAPHRSSFGGIRITSLGDVGIGVRDTKGYKLAIGGKAIAEEMVVKLQGNWPDYIFEPDYKLLSLEDLQKYIKENNHLPEVPSAEEMEQNGINLSDMNMILLKKVEELTLYLLELKTENKGLKEEIDLIKKKIN